VAPRKTDGTRQGISHGEPRRKHESNHFDIFRDFVLSWLRSGFGQGL
jgi:hypothetical protein